MSKEILMKDNAKVEWKTGAAGPIEDTSGPWLEINLDAVTYNIRQIQGFCSVPLMPVIKANAYGHGLVEVGRHLETLGVHGLCVGNFQEAARLRDSGIACPVLSLGPYSKAEAKYIVSHDISQSVFTKDVLELNRAAQRLGTKAKVHIKVDTGLGRLGVPCHGALEFIGMVAGLEHVKIQGIFTSLSEEKSFDEIQISRFTRVTKEAAAKGIEVGPCHAASSAAILEYPGSHLDMVRPGIMVVGCYPNAGEFKRRRIDLKQAIALKTRVSYVKQLNPGDSVAYHRVYKAESPELMATGAIGYPDGYPSRLTDHTRCLVNGKRFPLVAAVTINNIYIKATLQEKINIGDEIVLLGGQGDDAICVEELSAWSGAGEYQLLACLSPSLPRYYRGGR